MEFNGLHTLSLPFVVQDALIAVGAGVALLASLACINLGILLSGVLTSLGGPHPDQRGAYLAFGPAGAPVITEPATPRAMSPEQDVAPRHVARPNLWRSTPGAPSRI
jgi:hypothetical protein